MDFLVSLFADAPDAPQNAQRNRTKHNRAVSKKRAGVHSSSPTSQVQSHLTALARLRALLLINGAPPSYIIATLNSFRVTDSSVVVPIALSRGAQATLGLSVSLFKANAEVARHVRNRDDAVRRLLLAMLQGQDADRAATTAREQWQKYDQQVAAWIGDGVDSEVAVEDDPVGEALADALSSSAAIPKVSFDPGSAPPTPSAQPFGSLRRTTARSPAFSVADNTAFFSDPLGPPEPPSVPRPPPVNLPRPVHVVAAVAAALDAAMGTVSVGNAIREFGLVASAAAAAEDSTLATMRGRLLQDGFRAAPRAARADYRKAGLEAVVSAAAAAVGGSRDGGISPADALAVAWLPPTASSPASPAATRSRSASRRSPTPPHLPTSASPSRPSAATPQALHALPLAWKASRDVWAAVAQSDCRDLRDAVGAVVDLSAPFAPAHTSLAPLALAAEAIWGLPPLSGLDPRNSGGAASSLGTAPRLPARSARRDRIRLAVVEWASALAASSNPAAPAMKASLSNVLTDPDLAAEQAAHAVATAGLMAAYEGVMAAAAERSSARTAQQSSPAGLSTLQSEDDAQRAVRKYRQVVRSYALAALGAHPVSSLPQETIDLSRGCLVGAATVTVANLSALRLLGVESTGDDGFDLESYLKGGGGDAAQPLTSYSAHLQSQSRADIITRITTDVEETITDARVQVAPLCIVFPPLVSQLRGRTIAPLDQIAAVSGVVRDGATILSQWLDALVVEVAAEVAATGGAGGGEGFDAPGRRPVGWAQPFPSEPSSNPLATSPRGVSSLIRSAMDPFTAAAVAAAVGDAPLDISKVDLSSFAAKHNTTDSILSVAHPSYVVQITAAIEGTSGAGRNVLGSGHDCFLRRYPTSTPDPDRYFPKADVVTLPARGYVFRRDRWRPFDSRPLRARAARPVGFYAPPRGAARRARAGGASPTVARVIARVLSQLELQWAAVRVAGESGGAVELLPVGHQQALVPVFAARPRAGARLTTTSAASLAVRGVGRLQSLAPSSPSRGSAMARAVASPTGSPVGSFSPNSGVGPPVSFAAMRLPVVVDPRTTAALSVITEGINRVPCARSRLARALAQVAPGDHGGVAFEATVVRLRAAKDLPQAVQITVDDSAADASGAGALHARFVPVEPPAGTISSLFRQLRTVYVPIASIFRRPLPPKPRSALIFDSSSLPQLVQHTLSEDGTRSGIPPADGEPHQLPPGFEDDADALVPSNWSAPLPDLPHAPRVAQYQYPPMSAAPSAGSLGQFRGSMPPSPRIHALSEGSLYAAHDELGGSIVTNSSSRVRPTAVAAAADFAPTVVPSVPSHRVQVAVGVSNMPATPMSGTSAPQWQRSRGRSGSIASVTSAALSSRTVGTGVAVATDDPLERRRVRARSVRSRNGCRFACLGIPVPLPIPLHADVLQDFVAHRHAGPVIYPPPRPYMWIGAFRGHRPLPSRVWSVRARAAPNPLPWHATDAIAVPSDVLRFIHPVTVSRLRLVPFPAPSPVIRPAGHVVRAAADDSHPLVPKDITVEGDYVVPHPAAVSPSPGSELQGSRSTVQSQPGTSPRTQSIAIHLAESESDDEVRTPADRVRPADESAFAGTAAPPADPPAPRGAVVVGADVEAWHASRRGALASDLPSEVATAVLFLASSAVDTDGAIHASPSARNGASARLALARASGALARAARVGARQIPIPVDPSRPAPSADLLGAHPPGTGGLPLSPRRSFLAVPDEAPVDPFVPLGPADFSQDLRAVASDAVAACVADMNILRVITAAHDPSSALTLPRDDAAACGKPIGVSLVPSLSRALAAGVRCGRAWSAVYLGRAVPRSAVARGLGGLTLSHTSFERYRTTQAVALRDALLECAAMGAWPAGLGEDEHGASRQRYVPVVWTVCLAAGALHVESMVRLVQNASGHAGDVIPSETRADVAGTIAVQRGVGVAAAGKVHAVPRAAGAAVDPPGAVPLAAPPTIPPVSLRAAAQLDDTAILVAPDVAAAPVHAWTDAQGATLAHLADACAAEESHVVRAAVAASDTAMDVGIQCDLSQGPTATSVGAGSSTARSVQPGKPPRIVFVLAVDVSRMHPPSLPNPAPPAHTPASAKSSAPPPPAWPLITHARAALAFGGQNPAPSAEARDDLAVGALGDSVVHDWLARLCTAVLLTNPSAVAVAVSESESSGRRPSDSSQAGSRAADGEARIVAEAVAVMRSLYTRVASVRGFYSAKTSMPRGGAHSSNTSKAAAAAADQSGALLADVPTDASTFAIAAEVLWFALHQTPPAALRSLLHAAGAAANPQVLDVAVRAMTALMSRDLPDNGAVDGTAAASATSPAAQPTSSTSPSPVVPVTLPPRLPVASADDVVRHALDALRIHRTATDLADSMAISPRVIPGKVLLTDAAAASADDAAALNAPASPSPSLPPDHRSLPLTSEALALSCSVPLVGSILFAVVPADTARAAVGQPLRLNAPLALTDWWPCAREGGARPGMAVVILAGAKAQHSSFAPSTATVGATYPGASVLGWSHAGLVDLTRILLPVLPEESVVATAPRSAIDPGLGPHRKASGLRHARASAVFGGARVLVTTSDIVVNVAATPVAIDGVTVAFARPAPPAVIPKPGTVSVGAGADVPAADVDPTSTLAPSSVTRLRREVTRSRPGGESAGRPDARLPVSSLFRPESEAGPARAMAAWYAEMATSSRAPPSPTVKSAEGMTLFEETASGESEPLAVSARGAPEASATVLPPLDTVTPTPSRHYSAASSFSHAATPPAHLGALGSMWGTVSTMSAPANVGSGNGKGSRRGGASVSGSMTPQSAAPVAGFRRASLELAVSSASATPRVGLQPHAAADAGSVAVSNTIPPAPPVTRFGFGAPLVPSNRTFPRGSDRM